MAVRGRGRPLLPSPRGRQLLLLLLVPVTSLVSAGPTRPAASERRDARVWDMLRQESRSFMSAILPDKMAAHTHDVLWSAPLHERAAREHRIPGYAVLALSGPPLLQSHETELLDAALAPDVAGEFGRKGNRLDAARRVTTTSARSGGRGPGGTHEAELMPNVLTKDGEYGGRGVQSAAGQFGQRGSWAASGSALPGDEAAPSAADVGLAPDGVAPRADLISGLSSFPQTERVPYAQSVRDLETELKLQSEQAATSSPNAEQFTPPTFEEFPFDSLKTDSPTGEEPDHAQFIAQHAGDGNSDEQLQFDTSNFPNFPKFSFQPESATGDARHQIGAPTFGRDSLDRFEQGQTGSQQTAETEAARFPMFPGEQVIASDEIMKPHMKGTQNFMQSVNSDEREEVLQEMMKEEADMMTPLVAEALESDDMSSHTRYQGDQTITGDVEIKNYTSGLLLAPVTEERNTITQTKPAANQFDNFRESGAYPDLSLVGFPSFPDIPESNGNKENPFPVSSQHKEAGHPSTVDDTNNTTSPQLPTDSATRPLSYGESQAGGFVHPDIFPEVDFSPTAGDEFYARLESDPTFQTPTAPDLSFSGESRPPLQFPELRTQFPVTETDFSRQRPKFPELRTRFPQPETDFSQPETNFTQPEADFSHVEPEFPETPSLGSEEDDAFRSFAEVADLNRDSAGDVQIFTDEGKLTGRRAVNYRSPTQFGSRRPSADSHHSKDGGDQFQNTFFSNDFNRVTTQRPTTTSRTLEVKRPQHSRRPSGPRQPQGPPRPYPYTPRETAYGRHTTTTTTYRPAIFVNEGPKVAGKEDSQEKGMSTTPPVQRLSEQAFFPDRNNIPGYIPRPTRPHPNHIRPAVQHRPHTVSVEKPEPSPQSKRNIPGYIPRPTLPPQGTSEDQSPTSVPEDFSTTVSDAAAPIIVASAESEPPTSADLAGPTVPAKTTTDQVVSTPPPTTPPTTRPPTTRAATRRPYTFPPFRRRTTPTSAAGSGDATTSQLAPEFGTRITHRKPASSVSGDHKRRRRPGGRRRPTVAGRRRPSGGAVAGRGTRRRPGMRRRPSGGRRGATPTPHTTTPAIAETTTVSPTVEMVDESFGRETEQQIADAYGNAQHGDTTEAPVEQQSLSEDTAVNPETVPEMEQPASEVVASYGEIPVEDTPGSEVPFAPAPEETLAAELPTDEVVVDPMPHSVEESDRPVLSGAEEMESADAMQEELVPVEMVHDMENADGMTSQSNDDAVINDKVMLEANPNVEASSQVQVGPILSEVYQSTAEPMVERSPAVSAPMIDISKNTDIYVPLNGQLFPGEATSVSEYPDGTFEWQSTEPEPQEDDESVMLESEESIAYLPSEPSLEGLVDVRDETLPREDQEAVQNSNVLQEGLIGPTEGEQPQEVSVDENSLEGFGAFPVADSVDVSAVLQEELADGDIEEVPVADEFPTADALPGGDFFTEESLQALDDVQTLRIQDQGHFSGPSEPEISENILVPSSIPHQETISTPPQDEQQFGPETVHVTFPQTVPEATPSNTEHQAFGMLDTAPRQTTDGVLMAEDESQRPRVLGDALPTASDDSIPPGDSSSSIPEMASDRSEIPSDMPEIPTDMTEIPSEMPEILIDVSEIQSEMPEMHNNMPEVSSDMPEVHSSSMREMPLNVPQVPSDMSEMLNNMPEIPRDMPEMPANMETPNNLHDMTIDMPEMPSDMPEVPRDVPNMASDMTQMSEDAPPQMPMPGMSMHEFDNFPPMEENIATEMQPSVTEKPNDVVATHPAPAEVFDVEQQGTSPSGSMSSQPATDGDVSIPQDVTSQDSVPFGLSPMVEHQAEEKEDSLRLSDLAMPSDMSTLNAPISITSDGPVTEAMGIIPKGFGPPQTYSVIPEESSDESMLSGMTDVAGTGFPSIPGQLTPMPADSQGDMTAGDTMIMPNNEDIAFTGNDFDVRDSFDSGIINAEEDVTSEPVAPEETLSADPEYVGHMPEVGPLLAQPTGHTLLTSDGGPSQDTHDGSLSDLAGQEPPESQITGQGLHPSPEDQQPHETSAIPSDTAPPLAPPVSATDSGIREQHEDVGVDSATSNPTEDVGVPVSVVPVGELEEVILPDAVSSVTESDSGVVELVADQDTLPVDQYAPPADQYALPSDQYAPPVDEYAPPVDQYAPSVDQYAPPAAEPDVGGGLNMQDGSDEQSQEQGRESSPEQAQEAQELEQASNDQEQEVHDQKREIADQEQGVREQGTAELETGDQALSPDQEAPTGYGPPHSDTIVPGDATADDVTEQQDDVIAHASEGYEVPLGAPEQDSP